MTRHIEQPPKDERNVVACIRTDEYPLSTIFEVEFDIRAHGSDIIDLVGELAKLKPSTLDASGKGVLLQFRSLTPDNFPVAEVLGTLGRYGIYGGVQQAEWLRARLGRQEATSQASSGGGA